MRPRSIRGPSSSSTAGSTVTEPATAQAMTAIVPLGDAVEDVRADHELARHRDHDGRAGDEHRVAGGSGGALERLVRGEPAVALLARADDVEERVVDADCHPDQQHDRLDAPVEREHLADRPEQAERGDHRGRAEQHGHDRRDERAEGDQQHEQRDRHRQPLGTLQVVVAAPAAVVVEHAR